MLRNKENWPNIKLKVIQLVGGLVLERDDDLEAHVISLGKVAFWLCFLPAIWVWVSGHGYLSAGIPLKDIAPNHLTILLTLIGYQFGKKAVVAVKSMFGGRQDITTDDKST